MLKFLKNWTLPIAMLVGTLAYLVFAKWTFLAPAKPYIHEFVSFIMPWLIFAQLLLTYFHKLFIKSVCLIGLFGNYKRRSSALSAVGLEREL